MPRLSRAALLAAAGLLLGSASTLAAQATARAPRTERNTRAANLPAPMTPAAMRARLETYTADSMRGRLTGTEDHRKATSYIAEELRKMGLEPAGDNGTFLQRVDLVTTVLDTANSAITAGGQKLIPYVDYLPRNQGPRGRAVTNAPVVFAGVWGAPDLLAGDAVAGKAVIVAVTAENPTVIKLQAQQRFAKAAAIVIANFDLMEPELREALSSAPMMLDQPTTDGPELPGYLHISRATAAKILGLSDIAQATIGREGTAITGSYAYKKQPVESYNVVAILRGSDPVLRNEYVAVGAHSDHVGIGRALDRDSLRAFNIELRNKQNANGGRVTPDLYASVKVNMDSVRRAHPVARMDSIYNGADDDGSGSMAVLEVARAFAGERARPKRSIIFVWHAGEELGLFGSEHFTDHPTVPREQIVAQLNFDMVGRGKEGDEVGGGPNYAQLIGSRRLSTQLGDMVEQVSRDKGYNWAFDYQYDAAGHPEQYYCRSDHYMYARYGIPVVFMSTGGHADYHQVTDEVEFIDFEKLSKVARYAHDLAFTVADATNRPVVDKPKPDPNGRCIQ